MSATGRARKNAGAGSCLCRWTSPARKRISVSSLLKTLTPETLFERRWATTLLEQALARLRQEYAGQGKESPFEQLKTTLTEGRGSVAYPALAASLKMSEAAVKMAVHRLRQRYRECLRAEIAQTVATPGEIEDELRHVMGVFAK